MTEPLENEILTRDEVVAAIAAATREVFSMMLGIEITMGAPALEPPPPPAQGSGVVALVGLAGRWSGTGSFACTGEFACQLASHLLGTTFTLVDEEVLDAVGEMANMIIGNVKSVLEARLGPMGLSTPTVIFGRNFRTRTARVRESTVVPFESGGETMFVQLSLAPNQSAEPGAPRAGFQMTHVLTL
jgi:chemotaxis protein CheX